MCHGTLYLRNMTHFWIKSYLCLRPIRKLYNSKHGGYESCIVLPATAHCVDSFVLVFYFLFVTQISPLPAAQYEVRNKENILWLFFCQSVMLSCCANALASGIWHGTLMLAVKVKWEIHSLWKKPEKTDVNRFTCQALFIAKLLQPFVLANRKIIHQA